MIGAGPVVRMPPPQQHYVERHVCRSRLREPHAHGDGRERLR